MSQPAPFVPGPEMTIVQAAALREALVQQLAAQPGDFALDLGEVSEFDSAGLQLVVALRRSLVERGDALQLTAASATVRDALKVFGLDGLLADAALAEH